MDDLRFLIGVYKNSKKEIDIKAEINKFAVREPRRASSSWGTRQPTTARTRTASRKSVSVFRRNKLLEQRKASEARTGPATTQQSPIAPREG